MARARSPSSINSQEGQDFVVLGENDIDDYNEDGILPQSPEVLAEIQKWLQPTDYLADSSEYNKHLSSHVPGTGLWIQETEAYRQWHDSSEHGSLWTKAIAGAGKSVFAAMIASKLAKEENVPVLSFFFRQIVATNHDPQSLVRDWISMILRHSPPLQAQMKKYMDDRRALHNITTNELWQDLVQTLVTLPRVYCVVDALDEMDLDKQDFFKNLISLGQRKPSSIKLLMTSRPLPRIEAFLREPSVLQVRLEQLKVDKDIAFYVDYRLDKSTELSLELRNGVKDAIRQKAQGSFLYARLMMDELLQHMQQMIPDLKYIQRSLDWLPITLEDMYNGMLVDHSLRSRVPQELQLSILQWVTHSTRPLRLLEIASMIDFESLSGKTRKDTKAIARAACGPLLEILEDETVSVIHHSFTEFLTDTERNDRQPSQDVHAQFPVIDSPEAHKSMGLTCLRYLGSVCMMDNASGNGFIQSTTPRQLKTLKQEVQIAQPFLKYAMHNWYVHIRKAGSLSAAVLQELDEFMSSENLAFKSWIGLIWPSSSKDRSLLSAVHVTAWAGISSYMKHVLDRGDNSNGCDNEGRTPLSWASAKGRTDVVGLLLERVSEPDLADDSGLKPLHYAAQGDHHAIVKLLLTAGVSPLTPKTKDPGRRCGNSPSTIGHSPLLYASHGGCTDTVREMIPYLEAKDLNRSLVWAATRGKAEVVDLLLTLPGVQAESPDHSDTPLFLASKGQYYDVMKALLEHGASPHTISANRRHNEFYSFDTFPDAKVRGATPLHAVAGLDSAHYRGNGADLANTTRCLKLLLDAGSKVDAIDRIGKTSLHYAVCRLEQNQLNMDVLRMLLKHGADPTARDDQENTPLHFVALNHDYADVVELLLAAGASLNARRSTDGKTPLHTMMENIHALNIKPLIPHVTNWNVRDSLGNTPLHLFLSRSYNPEAAVEDLLAAGADLTCRNKVGDTPIHCFHELRERQNAPSAISLISAAGGDLEIRDGQGRTFLPRIMSGNPHFSQVNLKKLLDLGANISAIDYKGDSLLHIVVRKSHDPELIKFIIHAGADPLAKNNAGATLLHELLATHTTGDRTHTMEVMKLLLDAGISPDARDHVGQTPFHLASKTDSQVSSATWNADPFFELIKSQLAVSISSEDNNGIRPIHLAVLASESLVARFISYGLDATPVTNDDMTTLHIAAKARKCNTIGLLLDHFESIGRSDMLEARDNLGRTALHYACQSGRPESVALLLKSGASPRVVDVKGRSPLHACAEFEHDRNLQRTDTFRPDPLRSGPQELPYNERHKLRRQLWNDITTEDDTVRIREIIRLLLDHGACAGNEVANRTPGQVLHLVSPLATAVSEGCAEMVDELMPHVTAENATTVAKPWAPHFDVGGRTPYQQRFLINSTRPVIAEDDIGEDGDATQLCNTLLATRQHSAIEKVPALGADFYPRYGHNKDFLTKLAQYGYVSLFDKLGSTIQKKDWINGIANKDNDQYKVVQPYLITAARRELPNLDMIKLIVEKFGADLDYQPEVSLYQNLGGYKYLPGVGALHCLSTGKHWWHSAAMEYLISRRANIELKDDRGRTPLHIAVSNDHPYHSYRRRKIVEILLENGADPNTMDEHGLTCLNKAMHDIEVIRLLLKYGADINVGDQRVLFSAIQAQDVAIVTAIMESGADCNAEPKPVKQSSDARLPIAESLLYLVHFAAGNRFNNEKTHNSAIQIVKLLLQNGADPYLPYKDDSTIIHNIVRSGGLLQPFLDLPDFRLEHRDPKGRTILLAACMSQYGGTGPTSWSTSPPVFRTPEQQAKLRADRTSGIPTCALLVYEKGGDLTACDNDGNNALHLLLGASQHNDDEFKKTFRIFIDANPALVKQKNNAGHAPFHIAIQRDRTWSAEVLMKEGVDPREKDGNGNTPLHEITRHLCSVDAEIEVLPQLKKYLDLGISINEKNNAGETPVFTFFSNGFRGWSSSTPDHRDAFAPLEEAGADLFVRNNVGETLLHAVAKKQGDPRRSIQKNGTVDTFKFLLEKGLDPMIEDEKSRTALDMAAACGNKDILALFQRDGGAAMDKKDKKKRRS